jgi:hypothetical protein
MYKAERAFYLSAWPSFLSSLEIYPEVFPLRVCEYMGQGITIIPAQAGIQRKSGFFESIL